MVTTTDSCCPSASPTPSSPSPSLLPPSPSSSSLVSPRSLSESSASLPTPSPTHLEATTSAPPSVLPVPAPSTPSTPLSLSSPNISPLLPNRKPKLVDGLLHASCHQCKTTKVHHLVLACRAKADPLRKARVCRKRYCATCLLRTYGLNLHAMSEKELAEWICPSCHDACCCAACKRMKEKAYAEQMMKVTTQAQMIHPTQVNVSGHHHLPLLASSHRAEVMGMGVQGDLGLRAKSLNDYLLTAPSQPTTAQLSSDPDDSASATLHYQLQQLQHLHQMQQLQQTLQLLQALSNTSASSQPPVAGAFSADSETLSAPVSSVNSPRQPSTQPQSMAPQMLPSHPQSHQGLQAGLQAALQNAEGDDTFGHQLHLRIAVLRQQQQQEKSKVDPVNIHLPYLPVSIPASAASTPNEISSLPLLGQGMLAIPRAVSQPAWSMPVTPNRGEVHVESDGKAEEGEVDFGAIANKLMTAASLATRIFQEQQTGKQQQLYQQQCRLQQQQHVDGGYDQNSQLHHPPVVPLSATSSSSSLQAHAAYLAQHRMDGFQSSALSNFSYPPTSATLPSSHFGVVNEADLGQKVIERESLHRLQMSILQEQQRNQLQQLLQTEERIRQHSHATDGTPQTQNSHSSAPLENDSDRYSAPDPPLKRQCQSHPALPSDAMQQLQMKVEALQVEQRRLIEEEAEQREREEMGDERDSVMFSDLSPVNFLSDGPWNKFPSAQPVQLRMPGGGRGGGDSWPLEDGES